MAEPPVTLDLEAASAGGAAGGPALPERYEDLGPLGRGGMGEVRRVRDRHVGATLALKILNSGEADLRRRFEAEARITAQLAHPGIVAVQDLGVLPDGRLWYTMEEVAGRTFEAVIQEAHAAGGGLPALRRLVDAFTRACQAVAYAHARGVIHRDLKPENIMLGAFGEVRVMDWGLARVMADPDDPLGLGVDMDQPGTVAGHVMGTPGYMAPEQARATPEDIGPHTDVFSLGAVLYALLSARAPYPPGRAGWVAVMRGPPEPLSELGLPIPAPLADICAQAMQDWPEDRYPDASALAQALAEWLEGARRRAEATRLVGEAQALHPRVAALRAEAKALQTRANQALEGVPAHAPVEQKIPGWRLEDEAEAKRREARLVEADYVRTLRAALTQDPELREAHDALSDHYRARLEAAEQRSDADGAAEAEVLLRAHDRGRNLAWLTGDGALTLHTDPPGVAVEALRYELIDRRLVAVPHAQLGETPLDGLRLPRGSYLLLLRKPGYETLRYPVALGRLERWTGVPPGASAPEPLRMLPAGSVPEGMLPIPAGWFTSGGDPEALDGLPARRLWVDGFFIKKHPVTNAEYLAFLNDLVAQGREAEAERWCPRQEAGNAVFFRDADGAYQLGADAMGHPMRPMEPVVFISSLAAEAWCAWADEGLRLPHDQEWEKAARGVDGRPYPWGSWFDPTWCRMQQTLASEPGRALIQEHPEDEGPYGVRGMGGNVRDWCHNSYQREGIAEHERRVLHEPASPEAPHRMVRGGSYAAKENLCRAAVRLVWAPTESYAVLGFRPVMQWKARSS
ncbi:MAG: SUMF1/EgtB/PvdO family nonheme iron enzyme [Alphaproteobacteria bacterium]|nr:SUMF1/EgtB/PvdO family nonheme iron enzyme [Alphaproteobacteria bacterium]